MATSDAPSKRNWHRYPILFSNFIFYLLILLLPTQFGKHFWPPFAFVSGVRVDYLSPTLYFTDILIILLFILCVKKIYLNLKSVNHLFLVICFLFLILNIYFAQNPLSAAYGLLKLLEVIFFGWYVATHVNKKNIKTIALLFCFPLLFESLLAIGQFFHQGSLNSIFYFFGERTFTGQTQGIANTSLNGELKLRPYGTFPHPNVLAGYLTVAMAIVISNFQFSREAGSRMKTIIGTNFKKIFNILTLLLGTIALFLTMSRVAILLWVVFLTIFLLKNYFKKSKHILVALVCICSIGSILALSPLGSRFTSFSLGDEAVTQRAFLMEQATTMISAHPLFGVGLHNFFYYLPPASMWQNPYLLLQPVHNIYLLIAAETGLIGLGLFLYFIFLTYKRLQSKKFIIHNSYFIILSIVLTLGLFDHYFLTLQQGQLLFAFVLGLCWTPLR